MQFHNLTLIGTSHIAKQSVSEIRKAIQEIQPKIVCVELDKNRLVAMMSNEKRSPKLSDIKHIGVTGFIFTLIGGWAQRKLGKLAGIMPGEDMLSAVKEAKKNRLKVALIDQNVSITLSRLSKKITWKEKFRFISDIFRAIFFKKREIKRLGLKSMDLTKVPADKLITLLLKELKKNYPNVYNVLVEERNHVMASNLISLMSQFPDDSIIAVVGAGHIAGMKPILEHKYKKVFI